MSSLASVIPPTTATTMQQMKTGSTELSQLTWLKSIKSSPRNATRSSQGPPTSSWPWLSNTSSRSHSNTSKCPPSRSVTSGSSSQPALIRCSSSTNGPTSRMHSSTLKSPSKGNGSLWLLQWAKSPPYLNGGKWKARTVRDATQWWIPYMPPMHIKPVRFAKSSFQAHVPPSTKRSGVIAIGNLSNAVVWLAEKVIGFQTGVGQNDPKCYLTFAKLKES